MLELLWKKGKIDKKKNKKKGKKGKKPTDEEFDKMLEEYKETPRKYSDLSICSNTVSPDSQHPKRNSLMIETSNTNNNASPRSNAENNNTPRSNTPTRTMESNRWLLLEKKISTNDYSKMLI